ncbi:MULTISPECIES: DUF6229 family protein [Lysobacter]|uniref:DUF6229 family protein n=1 Tax=Lysobacter yananisis TaxID=1003114 RepID=A0ABY9PAH7_9GAMM|nr:MULTISPECIES: DUF6229 family protein [Lysobacter]QCW24812.1 hypothetical protein FE772_03115 [Lysobacter enzymogenes]QQQ00733.1 hypothetical protein JHW41_22100 [Lysobacter enzymogenes]UZW60188.1 DUF6229 family protein [Lysobacter enzymogenes]WMT04026.1 DUF6229 family protein [Lysobacter yananisis]
MAMDKQAADLTIAWRNQAGADHPAGPLFSSGEFAQADLVFDSVDGCTASLCTGSCTVMCCILG